MKIRREIALAKRFATPPPAGMASAMTPARAGEASRDCRDNRSRGTRGRL